MSSKDIRRKMRNKNNLLIIMKITMMMIIIIRKISLVGKTDMKIMTYLLAKFKIININKKDKKKSI